jgi:FKBP-type peptidyl-prolyl cis-trans isomerase (trigger factor)
MQITLNIKDEKQFLDEVKEIIRAQIKQIARDDIKQIYENEVTETVRKFVENSKKVLENTFENKMTAQLKSIVSFALDENTHYWNRSDFVKNKATEMMKDILPDIVKKKIDIEQIVENAKKDFIKKILDK